MTTVVFSSSRKLLRSLWAMLTVQMAANTLAKALCQDPLGPLNNHPRDVRALCRDAR